MNEPEAHNLNSPELPETIGLLGGTFDPIHKGHLHLAHYARQEFKLKKVLFVPTSIPPHKATTDIAPVEDRLAMLRLAIADNPEFEISTLELDRGGVSYTIDTLRELGKLFPAIRFRIIFGADMLPQLHFWKEAGEVLRLGRPIVATRPGSDFHPDNDETAQAFQKILDPSIHQYAELLAEGFLELPPRDISSTGTRAYVANGMSDRITKLLSMLPETVLDYILEKGLYRK
ncbi:MAG: nicotinate (nicotinamide) nucleotide adenylyltransferase [Planctomycetes bacterium]|nr:nicotinate (nicotinamide) nucleotide adenylyltransferase [Planctomycetota bacterium]